MRIENKNVVNPFQGGQGHCHQQASCEETGYPDVASYLILSVIYLFSHG